MARPATRPALGRGITSLIPSSSPTPPPASASSAIAAERIVFLCRLDHLSPQDGQPRQHFDQTKLDELSASIKDQGLIEPLVVRRTDTPDRYEIIAGERRWRASKLAGLVEVPVIVKDVSREKAFELALIENIQREDLSGVELAEAYHRLTTEHDYTHDQIAEIVRKSRTTITNTLRLLKLPERVRSLLMEGRLSDGHARALLGLVDLPEQLERAAETVVREELSVRDTESLVQKLKKPAPEPTPPPAPSERPNPNIRDLEQSLARHFGTAVQLKDKKGGAGGKILIAYGSYDELDRLLAQMRGA